ncbi:MAG: hypothetical protein KGI79_00905 [Patescibacteria group bacterium]|nr:hypothetical protein [Patescibacteria group bacterium]MDE2116422.1 hypothetical protein [Patescibacteria group bacterium]
MNDALFDIGAFGHRSEAPLFHKRWINDINPLSGHNKRRLICAPNQAMRDVHAKTIRWLRSLRVAMPSATACRLGDSAYRNVLRHKKGTGRSFNRYFFLMDIDSAYPSVKIGRMVDVLVALKPDLEERRFALWVFLARHCFDDQTGGLVTGAPASPDLFNLYCEVEIDRPMRVLCARYGLTYTRYLDDLTFSSASPIGKKKRRALSDIVLRAEFRVSHKKARVYDLRKGPVVINGMGVQLHGKVFVPRRTLDHIRGLLHVASNESGVSASVIHGKMSLLKAVTGRRGANRTEEKVFEAYERFRKSSRTS